MKEKLLNEQKIINTPLQDLIKAFKEKRFDECEELLKSKQLIFHSLFDFELFFKNQAEDLEISEYYLKALYKKHEKIIAHKPWGLSSFLLLAAKKGYVQLAKDLIDHDEQMLIDLLSRMIAGCRLSEYKKVVENIFSTEKEKQETILEVLRQGFNQEHFKTGEQNKEIIRIATYLVNLIPVNQREDMHLLDVICKKYEKWAQSGKFDALVQKNYLELISLLIERNYFNYQDLVSIYAVYLGLNSLICTQDYAPDYLRALSASPIIEVHHSQSNFEEFQNLVDKYFEVPQLKTYLLDIEEEYIQHPERNNFYKNWGNSRLRNRVTLGITESFETIPLDSSWKQSVQRNQFFNEASKNNTQASPDANNKQCAVM